MKKIRIRTNPNSDGTPFNLTFKLEQSFDILQILSLDLSQSDVYKNYNAEYGVLVGRVSANGGFGVPNAKVSIFIPQRDNEIPRVAALYPFDNVSDRDVNGKRYNLLPENNQGKCHKAVGSFPSKNKILDNESYSKLYDSYYKFTTTTNDSGDYMITGIPVGFQIVHFDVDISDIGFLSQKPFDLVNQGIPENQFESLTTFKSDGDIDSLVQVNSKTTSVNIIPFWGDISSQNEIGINRLDFTLPQRLSSNALFFGSIFSDDDRGLVNKGCRPRKRMGQTCNFESGEGTIEAIRKVQGVDGAIEYHQLDKDSQIDENGSWACVLPMNLNPLVTDEFGNLVPSEDPRRGIPSKAKYRFRIGLRDRTINFRNRSAYYLVPNMYNRFDFDGDTNDADFYEMEWNKIYTVANYIPRYQKNQNSETRFFTGLKKISDCEQTQSPPFNRIDTNFNPLFNLLCILLSVIVVILKFINNLIKGILFGVIQKFICLLQHPIKPAERSACRCRACRDLFQGAENTGYPPDWNGSVDNDLDGIDDRIQCAECYDGGDGTSPDCTPGFSVSDNCGGLCQTCDFTIITLNCQGDSYTDYDAWKDCTIQQLAEDLNVVTYEFYNDWLIGSLYSFLFRYRLRLKRNGKEIERFCDNDCGDLTGEHRKNKCRSTYIKFKDEFGNTNAYDINSGDGRGLISEYKNFLYYASRNDDASTNLSVLEKSRLLFATQIVPLGSQVTCDIDGTPYLLDNILPTSYQDSDGNQTLFDASNCLQNIQSINTKGISLISQVGVEIRVEELEGVNSQTFTGTDGGNYTAINPNTSSVINLDVTQNPDYGGQNGYIIFDRDTEVRRYLCENFKYFNVSTTYNTVNYPNSTYAIRDEDGDVIDFVFDECAGLNDEGTFSNINDRIHPYYLYFGIAKGKNAFNKLKNKYFDNCVR